MKKIILILTLLLTFSVFAQDSIPKMELKYNGFMAIDKDSLNSYIVLEFPNKTKSTLYNSALVYLNSIYQNPKNVLNTVPNEAIIINGATNAIKSDIPSDEYSINYNIKIQFKEGKVKFTPIITVFSQIHPELFDTKSVMSISDANSLIKDDQNCVWKIDKVNGNYFVFNKGLKSSFDNWINSYIFYFIKGIKENNW